MNFGDALTHLRNSQRVSRPDYGFKYIYLVSQGGPAGAALVVSGGKNGPLRPWFPTNDDLLADDWYCV